jgi:hypothetical protein
MDRAEAERLQAHLVEIIRAGWAIRDPEVRVTGLLRADHMIDITVVSALFAGKDGLAREAFFWPVFNPIPRSELIYMTYCLLLTPEEAARQFASGMPVPAQDNAEDWAE